MCDRVQTDERSLNVTLTCLELNFKKGSDPNMNAIQGTVDSKANHERVHKEHSSVTTSLS